MAPRTTRSKKVAAPVSVGSARTTRSRDTAAPASNDTARRLIRVEDERHALLILPRDASPDARVVSLINPATSTPSRYLFCPRLGLQEFTRVGPPKNSPRSCLIVRDDSTSVNTESSAADAQSDGGTEDIEPRSDTTPLENGYVLENGDVFVATPLDAVFLLTPLFSEAEGYYRPADDYLDQLAENSTTMSCLLRCAPFKQTLSDRLADVSATQDIGEGELVYRPQLSLLLKTLLSKSVKVSAQGLPASMEEALVQKCLEIPILPGHKSLTDEVSASPSAQRVEDQASAGSAESVEQVTGDQPLEILAEVVGLMRQRVALDFILASYLSPQLRASLQALLQTTLRAHFAPLEKHLEKVRGAKVEAQALRALSDNISRKRSAPEDDEAAEIRAEKKKKKEEDEKRKKAETRASKDLKKVDTTGMKKMSSFFTKSAPLARA